MKTISNYLIFILFFAFSDVVAQQADSVARLPIMKRKSQIFMAEIKTDAGTQKGILFEADSSGIVILDSMYQRVKISLKSIKFIRINRSNSEWYGFKVGVIVAIIYLGTAIGYAAAVVSSFGGSVILTTKAILTLTGIVTAHGLLFALLSKYVPTMTVDAVSEKKYFKKLRKLKLMSQQFLIEKHPNRTRLVYHNSVK